MSEITQDLHRMGQKPTVERTQQITTFTDCLAMKYLAMEMGKEHSNTDIGPGELYYA